MRTVLEEINRAGKFADSLQDLIVDKGSVTVLHAGHGDPLLLMYWSLCFDLYKGMLTAMREKFYSAGFALLRPIVESQLRAHLIVRNANDDIARIRDDTYRVNFDTIGAEIDAHFGLEGYTATFLRMHTPDLHSFTHSGFAQLVRHFDGDGVGARYDEEEIIGKVYQAASSVFMLNTLVTKHFNYEAEWKRTGELFEEFNRPH